MPRREAKFNADYEIARKPVAQAVIAVARNGGTKKELLPLLSMLTRIAHREGIDIKKCHWPASEDALGKQLSLLIPILTAKGVPIRRNENERPRTWTIPPLAGQPDEHDGQVTAINHEGRKRSDVSDTSSPSNSREGGITLQRTTAHPGHVSGHRQGKSQAILVAEKLVADEEFRKTQIGQARLDKGCVHRFEGNEIDLVDWIWCKETDRP